MLKGNKGEWSEIYAFCYLLSSGIIQTADKDLNADPRFTIPIIKILRMETRPLDYYPPDASQTVRVYCGNTLMLSFPKADLDKNIALMLNTISNSSKTFDIPQAEIFLKNILVTKLKESSAKKQDITIQINDIRSGAAPVCGFSIKSYLGGNPTLINASAGTNFSYEIDGCTQNIQTAVNSINTKRKIIDRMDCLSAYGCTLRKTREVVSQQFRDNMQFVDTSMPEMMSELVKMYYQTQTRKISDLTEYIKKVNPLRLSNVNMYSYKIKKLLAACALGMTPQRVWEGQEDANGGFIVVKKDGSVVCYHIYNRTEFEQYLYDYTYLDTPSTSKYGFADIYSDGSRYYIKLNLQVRFSKHS